MKTSFLLIVKTVVDLHIDYFVSLASLTEKEALVTSLQEELREAREKTTNDAVRPSVHTSGLSIETAVLSITLLIM